MGSKLSKILLYLRNLLDHAVMKKIILTESSAESGLSNESEITEGCLRPLSDHDECQRLLSAVFGADHLAIRTMIQLGLRSEELFALRRDDVMGDMLRIDEALVDGIATTVKTEASDASVYMPPDLEIEMGAWLDGLSPDPRGWLFPAPLGGPWLGQNHLNRVLKPAAVRGRVGVFRRKTGKGVDVESTDVNFQVLRTCATLFGAKTKDPRDTQAQFRHADQL